MLAVLTSRVARVVDRARTLEARLPRSAPAVAAALSFLREIFIATANLRIGPH